MTPYGRGLALRWLVTAVVLAGVLAIVGAFVTLGAGLSDTRAQLLVALVVLVAVGSFASVRVRIQSAVVGVSWTDAAILVCIVALPSGWVPASVGLGVLVAKFFCRLPPFKAAYNAAKDALSATVGLVVAIQLGVAGMPDALSHPWRVCVVALAVAASEHLIGVPVLVLASASPVKQVLGHNGDIKILLFVGKTGVAILTLWLRDIDTRLLAVVPPVALSLHLMYAGRVSARTELAAWQRLAATTEELNDTNLETVLTAAVVNAAKLFSAEEAEVFLRDSPDGPVLVRGGTDGVHWSGDPGQAPPRPYDGQSVTERLAGDDLKADLGEVRLHYAGKVRLTDREGLTLRTFASALRTAVRNASAFAEARRLALRNAHAALHDPLTGVANRRRLLEYGTGMTTALLPAADAAGDRGTTALVVLDLDLFREVNEALGHLAGDRLLAEVARRLERAAGPGDLVARLGGDEFAALLVGLPSPAAAMQRARDLLAVLDLPIDLDGMRVRVEASAGVAAAAEIDGASLSSAHGHGASLSSAHGHGASLSSAHSEGASLSSGRVEVVDGGDMATDDVVVELLRRADIAMYQAKRGGPRVVAYDASRDTADVAQLMLGGDLPRAISDREFAVSFQPIVDLATGDMISAEALARWHHPERGDLDPRRFLAAVERSGLLPAFAEAVLDQALAAMRRWRDAGIDATVAVNASPRSLLDPTFPRMVAQRLAAHGMRGTDLVIELTESLTMSQVELVGGVLRELRSTGIRLALDDFGTGYSSLAMLAKVPAYELKVDRSFVSAMTTSPEAMAVVRSTVELGRSLSRLVVAEGVESPEQRQALWEMGCRAGQGHLFGHPMPVDALLAVATAGTGGVVGRLCAPVHGVSGNVIDLPRARRPDADTAPEAFDA